MTSCLKPRLFFPIRDGRMGIVLCVWGVVFAATGPVYGQGEKPTFTTSAATLDTNTEIVKRLATVEDHVKSRQWEQAILILQKVEADHGDAVIAIDDRRYLNVTTYCNQVLANFPPEGLAVYREKHDAQAKQWLDAGLASRNPDLLEKVVQQAFVSRPADEALFVLGEWGWDRGEFAVARDYWRKLLKLPNPPDAGRPQSVLRYPDSLHSQAEVLSRIVLCHLMEGDESLAKRWLEYLAENHPEARGELAGRSGILAERVQDIIEKSQSWQSWPPPTEMPTFAGNPQRNYRHPDPPAIGGVQWEIPLPEHGFNPPSQPPKETEPSLNYFPAIVDETIYFADPNQIYAVDLISGKAKWPIAGDGAIKKPGDLDNAAVYQAAKFSVPRDDFRVGVPRFTLTIRENRLYARMGSPITGPISKTIRTLNSHLVCLDLEKQGKVVWTCKPDAVMENGAAEIPHQWAFEGSPVVSGGRVFVALRQSHPQTESVVACLDAESGKPLWTRRVASALANVGEQENLISHHLLTLGENMVFFVPEFGVVTALDARSGRLKWAVTYPSVLPKDSPILKNPHQQGFTPCVFHQGVVYAAPTDAESVLAISAKTGVILWEQRIPFSQDPIRHLLGVVNNRLVLSGNRLWILNATTGNVQVPRWLDPDRDPEFHGYGRGLIAGERIYWPTQSALEIRDFSGRRVKQPKPQPGGNLAIAGDLLISAESDRLVAYGNFAKIKETQRQRISENPQAATPYWRLAQAEAATGNLEQALRFNGRALELATPEDFIAGEPLKPLALENQYRLVIRLGKQALARDRPDRAADHFETAANQAPNLQKKAGALKLWGEALAQDGEYEAAVSAFQTILDDSSLSEVPLEPDASISLGEHAKSRIDDLIREQGREIYAEIDRRAAMQLADRLKRQDLDGVEKSLRRFPNAEISAATKHQLANLRRNRGEPWQALAAWQQLLNEPIPPETRRDVLWELAKTLEQQGYFRPARTAWRQLLREFPSFEISWADESLPVAEFVPRHLQSAPYRKHARPAPTPPFARRWERKFPNETQVVFPQGEAPGFDLACVPLQNRKVQCLDRSTGATRWQKQLEHPVLWAAYARTHLLLGTRSALLAVTLETGETLWRNPLVDVDEPDRQLHRFARIGQRVFALLDDAVLCFDETSGRRVWTRPAEGRLTDSWFADDEFLIVQTEEPLRIMVIETRTGKPLSEHRPKAPWTSPPVRIRAPQSGSGEGDSNGRTGFVVSLANREIRLFGAYAPQADPSWNYEGAYSSANAWPRLWSQGDELIVLMDGDTLIKLDPETGEPVWEHLLSHSPPRNLEEAIAVDAEHLYALADNQILCFDWEDGRIVWNRPLPNRPAWSLQKPGRYLFALSKQAKTAGTSAIVIEAESGRAVQELKTEPAVKAGDFRSQFPILVTKDKLIGWGRMTFSQAGELTRTGPFRHD